LQLVMGIHAVGFVARAKGACCREQRSALCKADQTEHAIANCAPDSGR